METGISLSRQITLSKPVHGLRKETIKIVESDMKRKRHKFTSTPKLIRQKGIFSSCDDTCNSGLCRNCIALWHHQNTEHVCNLFNMPSQKNECSVQDEEQEERRW